MKPKSKIRYVLAAFSAVLTISYAQAATLTWDAGGGGSAITNGAGAWLGANLWNNGGAAATWTSGDDAIFAGPATAGGAVTLASPTVANTLTFNPSFTGTYALGTAGQALTINNGITMNSGAGAVTFISPITLGGAQTWTNNSGTTLQVNTPGVTNAGNELTIDGTGTTGFGGINNNAVTLAGSGNLVKNGSGRFSFGGANTGFSGNVTLNGGVTIVTAVGSIGSGNLTMNGGVYEEYWSNTFTRTLGSTAGQVRITGGTSGFSENGATGMTVRLNNSAAFEAVWGSASFNPSTFVLQAASAQNGSSLTFDNKMDLNGADRTIAQNATGTATATIAQAIRNTSGTAAGIIKTGPGLLNLNGTNTYNGGTTINAGTLAFGSIAAMPGTGEVAVNNATLGIDLGTAGDWTTGTSGVGTLGGLLAGLGGAGTSTVTYTGNVGLRLNVGADSTYGDVIANPTGSSSLSLTKLGANVLTLSNDNSFTGAVNLNAGTLRLDHANAIDTATGVAAASGTTLNLRNDSATAFVTPLTTLNTSAGASMTINVDRVSSGSNNQLVLNGGLSSQQNSGNEVTINLTGGNGYTLSIPTLKIDRFGSGGGAGGTHLNATTTVAIGPVTSSATQTLFLRLRGTSTGNTLGAITHSGSALSIQKQEAGTWTLTGAGNYTGAVAITAGSLRITKNTSLGTTAGGVTQSGASELGIDGSGGAVTVGAEALTISGGGISNAGALRNIAGNNTYGGTVTLAAQSRINSDSDTLTLSNATSVTGAGQNLVVGGLGNVTISGAITTTTGFVSKDSAGTLTLSSTNNTYSGATTVNGGTLKLGANNVIPNASNVSIGNATLDADTRTDNAGTLDVTGTAVINLGTGAALAFADSKLVDWTGGTLNITGTLGATSLRFGTDNTGLTSGPGSQLANISVNGSGLGSYVLDSSGYLVPDTGTPEIDVNQGGDIANTGTKDFGTVTLGSNAPLTFTINNTGSAALNLTGSPDLVAVSGSSDFTVTAQPSTPVAASPGVTSTTFTVQFTPTAAVVRNATLTILNNDSDEGTFTINVTGTGQTLYQAWAGGALFDADANNDGVKNGLAFLLGAASPTSAVTQPTVTHSGGDLKLNFNCLPVSARGGASLKVGHSCDLGILDSWTATAAVVPDATNAVPDNNVTFVVGAGPVGPPALNSVTATIDSAAAAGGNLFGCLEAEQ